MTQLGWFERQLNQCRIKSDKTASKQILNHKNVDFFFVQDPSWYFYSLWKKEESFRKIAIIFLWIFLRGEAPALAIKSVS